jgi:hypothetical protein
MTQNSTAGQALPYGEESWPRVESEDARPSGSVDSHGRIQEFGQSDDPAADQRRERAHAPVIQRLSSGRAKRPGVRGGGVRRGDDLGDRPVPDGIRASKLGGVGLDLSRPVGRERTGFSRCFPALKGLKGKKSRENRVFSRQTAIFPVCFGRPRRKGSAGAAESGLIGEVGTDRLASL